MKAEACCFSGQRIIPPARYDALRACLAETVEKLVQNGVTVFWADGTMGFGQMAAEAVLHYRAQHPDAGVRLCLALPFPEQAYGWPRNERVAYERVKVAADWVTFAAPEYHYGYFRQCSRFMVRQSTVCVCYLLKPNDETQYTVERCHKKGVTVLNLAEKL